MMSFQIQFEITSSRSAFAVCLTKYAMSPRAVGVRQGTVAACDGGHRSVKAEPRGGTCTQH